jgi:hypothetical protein
MHERESIPASRSLPPAAEAVLSAPEIGEVLDPPHVIAMQRTAGNQATTAYLASAAEPPEPPA